MLELYKETLSVQYACFAVYSYIIRVLRAELRDGTIAIDIAGVRKLQTKRQFETRRM